MPEQEEVAVEGDAQAQEDQNGPEVETSKDQLVPQAASTKVGVEEPLVKQPLIHEEETIRKSDEYKGIDLKVELWNQKMES